MLSFVLDWLGDNPAMVPTIGVIVAASAYALGCRLFAARSAPAAEPVQNLEARFLQGLNRDRRSARRREGNAVEVELSVGREGPFRGWVLDRSMGGLGILVDQAFSPGTNLRVRPSKSSGAPWTDIVVRSCKEEGGQYTLGCQFHHTPNWSLLLQFG